MYGGYTNTNTRPVVFRKIKKENQPLYQIEDKIVPLEDLMTCQATIPLDISIRSKWPRLREKRSGRSSYCWIAHWLAVNGQQPKVNENPIVDAPRRTISRKKFDQISHILSIVNPSILLRYCWVLIFRSNKFITKNWLKCAFAPMNRNERWFIPSPTFDIDLLLS